MRIGFTIIYSGLHHLKHNRYAEQLSTMLDHWVVIEGLTRPGGSTAWCNEIHLPFRSCDGTHEYLTELSKRKNNVHYYSPGVIWNSKDEMVNKAIDIISNITDSCFLWQIDCDEQWTADQLQDNEISLVSQKGKCGAVGFHHHVGPELIVTGEYGSHLVNRLWDWKGEKFIKHEPAIMEGQMMAVALPEKFEHYSYYFEQDVLFKSLFYKEYEGLYENWKNLQVQQRFPQHISVLFGRKHRIGRSRSLIYRKDQIINTHEKERAEN